MRRVLTVAGLVLLSISALVLVAYPDLLHFLVGKPVMPWHAPSLWSIRVGFLSALPATFMAAVAPSRVRFAMVTAGVGLLGLWFMAGVAV